MFYDFMVMLYDKTCDVSFLWMFKFFGWSTILILPPFLLPLEFRLCFPQRFFCLVPLLTLRLILYCLKNLFFLNKTCLLACSFIEFSLLLEIFCELDPPLLLLSFTMTAYLYFYLLCSFTSNFASSSRCSPNISMVFRKHYTLNPILPAKQYC